MDSRRATDNMNVVSRTAHLNAGAILIALIPVIIVLTGALVKIYSDVQVGKQTYLSREDANLLSRTIDNKINVSSREITLQINRQYDLLSPEIKNLAIEIQKISVQMARVEEKINLIAR